VHATVGRQREDLDQRLGFAQTPRAVGDDAVADGDRETAKEADARLAAVGRGSPPVDERNVTTRRGRASRASVSDNVYARRAGSVGRGLDDAPAEVALERRRSSVRWVHDAAGIAALEFGVGHGDDAPGGMLWLSRNRLSGS
jgi:hypothetical protein